MVLSVLSGSGNLLRTLCGTLSGTNVMALFQAGRGFSSGTRTCWRLARSGRMRSVVAGATASHPSPLVAYALAGAALLVALIALAVALLK